MGYKCFGKGRDVSSDTASNELPKTIFHSQTHRSQSQRGFALVSLLVALPVLLVALAAYTSTLHFVQTQTGFEKICQTHMVRAQMSARKALLALLQLNPQAAQLQLARREAEARVLATIPYPPAHAAALAKLEAVILMQKLFHAKQLVILYANEFKSALAQRKASSEIHALINYVESPSLTTRSARPTYGLAVEPVPPGDDSPQYLPKKNFNHAQSFVVSWQMPMQALVFDWWQELLPERGFVFKGQCAMSLKEGQWEIIPIEDKSWWK